MAPGVSGCCLVTMTSNDVAAIDSTQSLYRDGRQAHARSMEYSRLSTFTRQQELDRLRTDYLGYLKAKALRLGVEDFPQSIRKASVGAIVMPSDPGVTAGAAAFAERLAQTTVLGQLNAIRIPVNTPVFNITPEAEGAWVADGAKMPVASMSLTTARTIAAAIVSMIAATVEALRTPGALAYLERRLLRALRHSENAYVLDTTAATSGLRPAGLLATAPSITGGSPDGIGEAVSNLLAFVSNGAAAAPAFIASPRGIAYLGMLRDGAGSALFPNLSIVTGGTLLGIKVIVAPEAGNRLVLIDGEAVAVSDDGLEVVASENAAVEMSDSASGTSGTAVVSGWQTNTAFLRATRRITWTTLSDDGVAYVELDALNGSPA